MKNSDFSKEVLATLNLMVWKEVMNDDDVINQKEYVNMVGSLYYATDCNSIAYAVRVVSRFTTKLSRKKCLVCIGSDHEIFIQ